MGASKTMILTCQTGIKSHKLNEFYTYCILSFKGIKSSYSELDPRDPIQKSLYHIEMKNHFYKNVKNVAFCYTTTVTKTKTENVFMNIIEFEHNNRP